MVKLRKYHRRGIVTGEWEVEDVRVELANGEVYRERRLYRESSFKADARAWGEDREQEVRALARRGLNLDQIRRALRGEVTEIPTESPRAPTLEEFWPTFIEGYAKASGEALDGRDAGANLAEAPEANAWFAAPRCHR